MSALFPIIDLRHGALILYWHIAESGRPVCVWVRERAPDDPAA